MYAVLAAATVAGAVYGYRVLLAMSRVLAVSALPRSSRSVCSPTRRTSPPPRSRRPAAICSARSGRPGCWRRSRQACPGRSAFITLLGDYTRYISPSRTSQRFYATWLGLIAGLLVPQLFGTFTAYAARAALDYAGPLVSASPTWYLVPLLLAASAGRSATRA